jgi:hypothetical protein
MDEMFVFVELDCACETKLHVHCQHIKSGQFSSRHFVCCPKCKAEHELPPKPLRFFYKELASNVWHTDSPNL